MLAPTFFITGPQRAARAAPPFFSPEVSERKKPVASTSAKSIFCSRDHWLAKIEMKFKRR
jgi:hypothetical protein